MGQHWPEEDFSLSNSEKRKPGHMVRPFLLHINNPWKIDGGIFGGTGPTYNNGKRIRIFGTKKDIIDSFGFDLEERLWMQVILLNCKDREQQGSCNEAKDYYSKVFANEQ